MRKNIFAILYFIPIVSMISCFWANDTEINIKKKNNAISSLLESFNETDNQPNDQSKNQPDNPPKIINGNLFFSNDVVKDINYITSENEFLYLAAQYEIIEYNTKLNIKRTLTGNLSVPYNNPSTEIPVLEWPNNLIKKGEYIYYSDGDKIQKIFTGNDDKSAVDTIVTSRALSNSGANLYSFACNDENVFWAAGTDDYISIYKKDINNYTIPQKILTVNSKSRLQACNNFLYISSGVDGSSAAPRLQKYDIESKNLTILQDNIKLNHLYDIPVFCGPIFVYWVNGESIYRSHHDAGPIELIISGLSDIIQLTANDDRVYALYRKSSGTSFDITEIGIDTKKSRSIYSGSDIRGILFHENALYWASASKLFRLNTDGTVAVLIASDGSFAFGGIECGAQDTIILTDISGNRLFCYDIRSKNFNFIKPVGISLSSVYANSYEFYLFGYNHGIRRMPADMNFRQPVTIRDGLCGIERLFLQDNFLYWSEHSAFCESYRISRIKSDGSDYGILFDAEGNNNIRGLVLYDNRLYFTYRPDQTSPWCLASISLNGENLTSEYSLGYGPVSLTEKNGIFYLADTMDKFQHTIYSINLNENNHSELITGLLNHYITDEYADLYTIYATDKYIYYRSYLDYLKRDFRIKSNEIVSWKTLGEPEIIEDSSPRLSNQFYSFDNYFYYAFKDGLRYINE